MTAHALTARTPSLTFSSLISRMLAATVAVMLTAGALQLLALHMGIPTFRAADNTVMRMLLPAMPRVEAPRAPIPDPDAGLTLAERIGRWQPYIAEASQRFSVPESWIRAVMRAESGGRLMLNGQPITSSVGAAGLMQLMRETYDEMRARYSLGKDAYDPRDNILAGAAYLKVLKRKYGFPNMFAAYNAGPGKLDDHLTNGKPLPAETQAYLVNVVKFIGLNTARASHLKQAPMALAGNESKHFVGRRVHATIVAQLRKSSV